MREKEWGRCVRKRLLRIAETEVLAAEAAEFGQANQPEGLFFWVEPPVDLIRQQDEERNARVVALKGRRDNSRRRKATLGSDRAASDVTGPCRPGPRLIFAHPHWPLAARRRRRSAAAVAA